MKRFYKKVEILASNFIYQIKLDDRILKTPSKKTLNIPTKILAHKIAEEWSSVENEIIPEQMPFYSLTVTAIDRVESQKPELIAKMQHYIMNDLLCYRESEDAKLQEYQNKNWNQWLLWSKKEYNFDLKTTNGVMPINQDENNKNLLLKIILPMNIWHFSGFVKATTLTGSAILALAFVSKQLEAEELFSLCFLDELYQIKRWGEDEEALQKRSAIKNELFSISDFLRLTETR